MMFFHGVHLVTLVVSGKGLWWLILCVNLPGPWMPRYWSNIIMGESVSVFLGEINI